MINILDFSLDDLKSWMKENGEKEFRGKQVFDWIYNEVWNFDDMKNITGSLRNKLKEVFYIGIPEVVEKYKSQDNNTEKFLLKYKDGNIIECVIMKYSYGNSICVSTQVGCRMGCGFCASTIGGVLRDLTSGEILGEILRAQKDIGERISNVVLMGSGEPLDNYENVIKFINNINSKNGLNIGQRHITLSTCGIVPKIYDLANLEYQITLAISLHASNNEDRRKIMPVANKYSIEELLKACDYYIKKTNRRITFEYALVKGVNDNVEKAQELGNLIKGMLCHVNLIPVNEVVENNFKKPSKECIKAFSDVLNSFGIENTVRREMGADINAACGQLRKKYINEISKEGCKNGGDVI